MEPSVYANEAIVEANHWWFVGRRKLFAAEIARAGISNEARVLDIGTSTGTNLRMLRELSYRHVTGLDFSQDAIRFCEEKGLGPVRQGDVCAMPFADESFDLVLATDIVEHVDDDRQALKEIARVLAPGGTVLITVPAFQALWGLQDDVAQHKRRYTQKMLAEIVAGAALQMERRYYFNYLLFAPIWVARKLIHFLNLRLESENRVNTRALNRILSLVFEFDIRTAPAIHPPFGVSILAIAQKNTHLERSLHDQ